MFTSDARPNGASDEACLRRWAREHYVSLPERSLSWPGYVLDEMRRMDAEAIVDKANPSATCGCEMRIDAAHTVFGAPKLLLRVATLPQSVSNAGRADG